MFVPTPDAVSLGSEIKKNIQAKWKPPSYYYHLRSGGHVAALRSHVDHTSFLHLDIQDFFGTINKTRVTRCLKPIFGYKQAREWANASTVPHPSDAKRTIVPYGFVQSQLISSLCLEASALGQCLHKVNSTAGAAVSVYVDDIIVSTSDPTLSEQLQSQVKLAAVRAKFTLNPDKEHGPAKAITAFNIHLSSGSLAVEEERLERFVQALAGDASEARRQGIISYVTSVNAGQGSAL